MVDLEARRLRNKRSQVFQRIKTGELKVGKCFRCLGNHPVGQTEERYCPLTAEYNGFPWENLND